MPEKTIAHEPERSRYALRLDDRVVGVADYRRDGDALAITRREYLELVPAERRRAFGLSSGG